MENKDPDVSDVARKRKADSALREEYLHSMKDFWQAELEKMHAMDFTNLKHPLPLSRIRKIMKSDEDVRMISAEAPVVFAKACELFILDLTIRAWSHTDQGSRRTLQRSDVAEAIANSEMFDFLTDVVPQGAPDDPEEAPAAEYTQPQVPKEEHSHGGSLTSHGAYPNYPSGQPPGHMGH